MELRALNITTADKERVEQPAKKIELYDDLFSIFNDKCNEVLANIPSGMIYVYPRRAIEAVPSSVLAPFNSELNSEHRPKTSLQPIVPSDGKCVKTVMMHSNVQQGNVRLLIRKEEVGTCIRVHVRNATQSRGRFCVG